MLGSPQHSPKTNIHKQPKPQPSSIKQMNALSTQLNQDQPLHHEDILQLQRQIGNQATIRYLQRDKQKRNKLAQKVVQQTKQKTSDKDNIQRYSIEENYEKNSTLTNELFFESQGVSFKNGTYYRIKKYMVGGMLIAEKEEYSSTDQEWKVVDRNLVNSNPPMRVSENGQFAMEAISQSRTFYIQESLIPGINAKLKAQKSTYYIQKGTASLTFPSGVAGRDANFTLTQASAVREDDMVERAQRLEDMSLSSTRLIGVCHDIAQKISSTLPSTDTSLVDDSHGTDEEARPVTGQKYFLDNQTDTSHTTNQMPLTSPNRSLKGWLNNEEKAKSLDTVINELKGIDEKLDKVDENYSQVEALKIVPGGMSDEAKAMIPGWGDHSEAVIINDGNDDVTLVNYNRTAEKSWVMAHQFRKVYRDHKKFRSAFKKLYTQALNKSTGSVADVIGQLSMNFGPIVELMAQYDTDAADAMNSIKDSLSQLGIKEFGYFDMYGAEEQSFHAQFKTLGGRGSEDITTKVVGTPTEEPEPEPEVEPEVEPQVEPEPEPVIN